MDKLSACKKHISKLKASSGRVKLALDYGDALNRMKYDSAKSTLGRASTMAEQAMPIMKAVGGGVIGLATIGLGVKFVFDKIKNDTRRSAMINDLMATDPIIKTAPKEEVMMYYATIFNTAPTVSLDKNAVRELLQNFIKFGRIDVATIKMLSEIEHTMSKTTDPGLALISGK